MKTSLKIMLLPLCVGFFLTPVSYAQKKLLAEAISQSSIIDTRDQKIENNLKAMAKSGLVEFFRFDRTALNETSIEIEVEQGKKVVIAIDETDKRGSDNFTLYGRVVGQKGSAVFVFLNNALLGYILLDHTKYVIMPFHKGAVSFYKMRDDIDLPDHIEEENNGMQGRKLNDGPASATDASVCKVRVLVAYTNQVRDGIIDLGFDDVKLFIEGLIAETNWCFENSQVNHRVELAIALNVDYTAVAEYHADFENFLGASDGYMDNVHAYRKAYNADLCALVYDYIDGKQPCGYTRTTGPPADEAYCILDYKCELQGNFTFAHELGHLYGCHHNITPKSNPVGPYPFGHGYVYVKGGWRTVMSGRVDKHTDRVPYFSNPDTTFNGVPMGDEDCNNARVLNLEARNVSDFLIPQSRVILDAGTRIDEFDIADASATKEVILSPGFVSSDGSIFHASIGNCSNGSEASQETPVRSKNIDTAPYKGITAELYPNPGNGIFNLDIVLDKQKAVNVTLYSALGKEIFKKDLGIISKSHLPLDITQGKAGLYTLKIQAGNEVITRQLVLIK